jgi:anti-anti-sigma regulatory factor
MNIEIRRDERIVCVTAFGSLTFDDVRALRERLSSELEPDGTLVIDAKAVTCVDTSAAQLLLWACQRVREARVEAPSQAWRDMTRLLGLEFEHSACSADTCES